MKKTTAGAALAAAIGFSALSATPAMAVPYVNCTAAEADGVYNIQVGDSRYGEHLDEDLDGIGCENGNRGLTPVDTVNDETTTDDNVTTPVAPVAEQPQISELPAGAVDAGVTVEESTNTGIIALAGGLALAGAAGATVVVRRRNAQA
ncbi:excalibur calcium-binding domain-containing protein [Kocuria sp. LHG3120]|uniref:excalibur calcium-binding domain-containing protein n=1 Tax=Kocuria sp. LHG3120 TaxID=2804590 RepID=UPI003CE74101